MISLLKEPHEFSDEELCNFFKTGYLADLSKPLKARTVDLAREVVKRLASRNESIKMLRENNRMELNRIHDELDRIMDRTRIGGSKR